MIYKNVLQAQYEEKIQEQASNLCRQINDRLRDIEAFHKQVQSNLFKMSISHSSTVLIWADY